MRSVSLKPLRDGEVIRVIVRPHASSSDTHDVLVGDRPETVKVERDDEHAGRVTIRGHTQPYRVIRRGDVLHLWLAGRVYEIEIVPRTARRVESEAATRHADQLTAPMPGTILKITHAEGASYEAFEPIIIMESMKMEMTLSSPSPGVVKELRCGVGDLVELGALLARLEPAES